MRREYDKNLYDPATHVLEMTPFFDYESYVQRKLIARVLSDKEQLQVASQVAIFLKDIIVRNGLKLAVRNNIALYTNCNSLKKDTEKLIAFINKDIN